MRGDGGYSAANLERSNVTNDKAVVDGNGEEAGIGGEAAGPRLLVGLREIHRRSPGSAAEPNACYIERSVIST